MFASVQRVGISTIEILKETRPNILSLTDNDVVAMMFRFVRQESHMRTSHDHFHSILSEPPGDFITMTGVRRIDRYSRQIDFLFVGDGLVVLIDKDDFIFGFVNKTCQIWHGNLNEVVELPFTVSMNFRALRSQEQNSLFHRFDCMSDG